MIVSTRGRYALRVMIDIAEHPNEPYIPLKSIAARQGISEKYLESILKILVQEHLLEACAAREAAIVLLCLPVNTQSEESCALQKQVLNLSAVLNLAQPPALRHRNAAQSVCG